MTVMVGKWEEVLGGPWEGQFDLKGQGSLPRGRGGEQEAYHSGIEHHFKAM